MITKIREEHNLVSYEKKANQAFSEGSVVTLDANGLVVPATSSTALADILGVMTYDIDSSHPQYAGQELVSVDIPEREEEYLADVGAGSTASLKAGDFVDLQDATSVNVGASTIKVFEVVRVISATQIVVRFNV